MAFTAILPRRHYALASSLVFDFLREENSVRLVSFATLMSAAYLSFGFVHLTRYGAKLPATPESPVITFIWDGTAPKFTGLDEFENGKYASMSNAEITEDILKRAYSRWNSIKGSYLILRLAKGEGRGDTQDKQYSVYENSAMCERGAGASPSFSHNLRTIVDCDVGICPNSVDIGWFFLEMIHETGHCLGLGHPDSSYSAIMSYSNAGKISNLTEDDMAGVISLYPDPAYGDPTIRNAVNCGTIAVPKSGPITYHWLLVAPLMLVILTRFRRFDAR